jgi:uncharacterized protein DUF4128
VSKVRENVRAAMRQRLLTTATLPTAAPGRAWENWAFEKAAGTPWLRDSVSGGLSELASIGPRARVRHEGLYFLDFFFPADTGMKAPDTLVDEILTATFYPGLQVSYGGLAVSIRRVSSVLPEHEPGWVQVPTTIAWRAHTVNPN